MFVFHFAAMSRRISLKKLGEKVEKAKGESSTKKPTPVKGVVIGEKRPMDEPSISPSKKANMSPKGSQHQLSWSPRIVEKFNPISPTQKIPLDRHRAR